MFTRDCCGSEASVPTDIAGQIGPIKCMVVSVLENDVSLACSVFDSSGKILAYRALGDDRFQNGEDLNGILEGSSSGAMGANLSVEGLLAVGVLVEGVLECGLLHVA